jgi:catechol-2,3-dioxygenase
MLNDSSCMIHRHRSSGKLKQFVCRSTMDQLHTSFAPAGVPYSQASQFDHLALALADEQALLRLRDRLKEHNCEVTDVVDHGTLRSIYFTDPNGIALEASWWVADPTGRSVDYADERFFADPDPVDAVKELRDTGTLAWTPRTQLVSDVTMDLYKLPPNG